MQKFAVVIVLMLGLFSSVTAQDDNSIKLTIANESEEPICAVGLVPFGAESLDEAEIYNQRIDPGTSPNLDVRPGIYTVALADCAERALLYAWYDMTLTSSRTFTYPDPHESVRLEISNLTERGAEAYQQGRFDEALDDFEEALDLSRQIDDQFWEGSQLISIGSVYSRQGRIDEAETILWQAIDITRETGDRLEEGRAINQLGHMYWSLGRFVESMEMFEVALDIMRETVNPFREARTLSNIGAVHLDRGDHEQALTYFEQALVIQREIEDRSGEGTTLFNMGQAYELQGRTEEALTLYTQALEIARKLNERSSEAVVLGNMGSLLFAQGRQGEAMDYFHQAEDVVTRIGDPFAEVTITGSIGLAYASQDQDQRALAYYLRTLELAQQIGDLPSQGRVLNNIGIMYNDQREWETALDYFQQAREILETVGDREGVASTLRGIGGVYQNQGDLDSAMEFYEQALNIAEETGNQLDVGVYVYFIGTLYMDRNEPEQAIAHFQQALEIFETIGHAEGREMVLISMAVVYDIFLEDYETGMDYYKQALESQESLLQSMMLDEAMTGILNSQRNFTIRGRLAGLLVGHGEVEEALTILERGRAVLTRDALRDGAIDFRENLDDQVLLETEERLRLAVLNAQNRVNALTQDIGATPLLVQDANVELDTAQAAYDQHLERMQLQGGFLAREVSFETATIAEMQNALPDDTTLVIYEINESASHVVLVTAEDVRGSLIDTDIVNVDEAVRAFAADRQTNTNALRDLYDLVFAPIADDITTSNLLISPNGALNYVPFAALQAPDGRYLIDDYTLSLTPSGTALVLLDERQPQAEPTSPALVLAQPDAPGLPRLANARSEALDVAETLSVSANVSATETDLRENSTGAAVVHISAHAELNTNAPLFSTIHLAEDETHDGRFEVREIYELDLFQGTELVILSGCETGSGGTGEDFGLLTRAFFGAGADRVVASLWRVDDEATAALLTAFIAAREDAPNDAAALREAMLTTRETYPDPYLWASFVLVGQP